MAEMVQDSGKRESERKNLSTPLDGSISSLGAENRLNMGSLSSLTTLPRGGEMSAQYMCRTATLPDKHSSSIGLTELSTGKKEKGSPETLGSAAEQRRVVYRGCPSRARTKI